MDKETMLKRAAELTEQEKQAWAHLNFVCGARSELERIIATMDEPAAAPRLADPQE